MKGKWVYRPFVILFCTMILLCQGPKLVQAAVNPCDRQDNLRVPYDNSPWLKHKGSRNDSLLASYSGDFKIHILRPVVDGEDAGGKKVSVEIEGSGSGGDAAHIGFHIYYDTRLTLLESDSQYVTKGSAMSDFEVSSTLIENGQLYVNAKAKNDNPMRGPMMYLWFRIPEDARPGEIYPIGFQYTEDSVHKDYYTNLKMDAAGGAMEAHVFTRGISNGFILLSGRLTSGKTGDCTWHFNESTGVLRIDGNGAMADYATSSEAPWYVWYKEIKKIEIGSGVTYIGNYAFVGAYIKQMFIPKNVKKIGKYAFLWCYYLNNVQIAEGLQVIGPGAFANNYIGQNNLTQVVIPESVTSIGACAFGYRYHKDTGFTKINSFKIHGICGSAAGTYAKKNSFSFVSLQHKWDTSYTTDREATCTKDGSRSIHCVGCNAVKEGSSQSIPKKGHSYGSWTILKEADAENDGLKERTCTVCGHKQTKTIPKDDNSPEEDTPPKKATGIVLGETIFTYNGKVQKPDVAVTDGKMVVSEEFYMIKWPKGCKKVGTYTLTVAMKGDYAGTLSASYKIIPRATAISKLTSPAEKQLKVTWKKRVTQVDGFQIQYATNKSFAKAKKVTIKSNTRTSAVIKKLTSKKTYYLRVRSYKKVAGKTYFSKWCKAKKLKVK